MHQLIAARLTIPPCSAALAEVTAIGRRGLEPRQIVTPGRPPETVSGHFVAIPYWRAASHTYRGDASLVSPDVGVAGWRNGGFADLAPVVDGVLTPQSERFAAAAARR